MAVIVDNFEVISESAANAENSDNNDAGAQPPAELKPNDILAVFQQHEDRLARLCCH